MTISDSDSMKLMKERPRIAGTFLTFRSTKGCSPHGGRLGGCYFQVRLLDGVDNVGRIGDFMLG